MSSMDPCTCLPTRCPVLTYGMVLPECDNVRLSVKAASARPMLRGTRASRPDTLAARIPHAYTRASHTKHAYTRDTRVHPAPHARRPDTRRAYLTRTRSWSEAEGARMHVGCGRYVWRCLNCLEGDPLLALLALVPARSAPHLLPSVLRREINCKRLLFVPGPWVFAFDFAVCAFFFSCFLGCFVVRVC
eukprot:3618078-Rhodomonas_salina.12